MGGCRCTYRNCSSRSDGKIHMFHYPVFDKVRCHQWLTNAQKLEFLNLKVSQLKNRVVCQYHFKDECFMNFKKDKLTFDAVPTINGPNCDSSQQEKNSEQDEPKSLYLSISLDDIENDYLSLSDKKANFSVKYGDFLTNCDLISLDPLNEKNQDINTVSDPHSLLLLDQLTPRQSVKETTPIQAQHSDNISKKVAASVSNISTRNIHKRPCKADDVNNRDVVKKTDLNQALEEKEQNSHLLLNVLHVPVEFESILNEQQLQKSEQSLEGQKLDQSFVLKPDQSFVLKPDQSFVQKPDQLFVLKPDQSFVQKPDQSFVLKPDQSFVLKPDQSFDQNPEQAFNQNPEQLFNQEPVQSYEVQTLDQSLVQKPNQSFEEQVTNEIKPQSETSKKKLKESKKIRIISEKQVSVPMPIIGKLEPVSPSKVLFQETPFSSSKSGSNPVQNMLELNCYSVMETALQSTDGSNNRTYDKPKNVYNKIIPNENNELNNKVEDKQNNRMSKLINNEIRELEKRIEEQTSLQLINENNELENRTENKPESISKQSMHNDNNGSNDSCQSKGKVVDKASPRSLLKPVIAKKKIPEERIAAIAEKRKFNMKLRDIIENCLDKLDEPHIPESVEKSKQSVQKSRATQCEKQVSAYLAEEPELPRVQDYTLSYLESRLKKMENNLMHKIDQNTQRIHELKETCFIPPTKIQKKAVHTQTSLNEEQCKRQLYNDISKYLSSDANSLIYEELFIKQFTKKVPKLSPSPKRKRYSKRSKKSSS